MKHPFVPTGVDTIYFEVPMLQSWDIVKTTKTCQRLFVSSPLVIGIGDNLDTYIGCNVGNPKSLINEEKIKDAQEVTNTTNHGKYILRQKWHFVEVEWDFYQKHSLDKIPKQVENSPLVSIFLKYKYHLTHIMIIVILIDYWL